MNKYPAERVFNVGVFSHGGAGRTTLVEAMLFDSGATSRRGRVSLGTTASDTDPEEVKRHTSLTHSVIPIEYNDCKINMIDTPDFADFGGDVRSAMRVVEAAIKACETVDKCAKAIVEKAIESNYTTLIIADHGNSEVMINPDGSPNTAHTTNPVPLIIVDNEITFVRSGILADIAPTILHLMGIEKPEIMDRTSLV